MCRDGIEIRWRIQVLSATFINMNSSMGNLKSRHFFIFIYNLVSCFFENIEGSIRWCFYEISFPNGIVMSKIKICF